MPRPVIAEHNINSDSVITQEAEGLHDVTPDELLDKQHYTVTARYRQTDRQTDRQTHCKYKLLNAHYPVVSIMYRTHTHTHTNKQTS